MRIASVLRFSTLSGILGLAGSVSLYAQSTIITSCVSKLSGVSRIVAAPTSCNAAMETVVQWNQQGSAGPRGQPGPPGDGLTHIIPVPATSDQIANGEALAAALANMAGATAATPYVLQLDAGHYSISSNLTVPAYVSLRGGLVGSTTIMSNADCIFYPKCPVFALNLAGANTLADLTLGESSLRGSEVAIMAEGVAGPTFSETLLRDVSSDDVFSFTVKQGLTIKIQNSNFASVTGLNPSDLQSTSLLVIDSQVGAFNLPAYKAGGLGGITSGVNCISTFNSSITPYTNNCR